MSNLTENLRDWRDDRNIIESNTQVYVENVIEELLEIFHKDKDTINYYKARIMLDFFADKLPISTEHTLDAMQDIQVFSINEVELMGYDNLKCNDEVFKEINSRVQDPKQKKEWSLGIGLEQKWQKDKLQDKSILYTADYSKCLK